MMLSKRHLSLSVLSANWQLFMLVALGIIMLCCALFLAERSVHLHFNTPFATPEAFHLPEQNQDYSGDVEKIQHLFQPDDPTPGGGDDRWLRRDDALMSSDDARLFNAPASNLPVQVTGIISSSLPQRSLLIVQSNSRQYSLSPGDPLPESGAELIRIFPDRAIIHYQGKYASLKMAD
ncbi:MULTISPECIES: type II secretion system protein N [unclassified Erwinia]|uniref:type II secretion system protein N n=1 Tax=unclassified Erwinia TaxID=2622719 RepID=UPI0009ECAEB7|nr:MULTISPECIES: type II secretion system protein N [unclassified Erwinia]